MKYKVEQGSIVDSAGQLLYESYAITNLSRAARKRLAELHTLMPDLCWEGDLETRTWGAEDYLIHEKLIDGEVGLPLETQDFEYRRAKRKGHS